MYRRQADTSSASSGLELMNLEGVFIWNATKQQHVTCCHVTCDPWCSISSIAEIHTPISIEFDTTQFLTNRTYLRMIALESRYMVGSRRVWSSKLSVCRDTASAVSRLLFNRNVLTPALTSRSQICPVEMVQVKSHVKVVRSFKISAGVRRYSFSSRYYEYERSYSHMSFCICK